MSRIPHPAKQGGASFCFDKKEENKKSPGSLKDPGDINLACPRGFEPPTPWSVAKCSIQLSYEHTLMTGNGLWNYLYYITVCKTMQMPATGIEPVRCHHHRILSPARLPVPPRRPFALKQMLTAKRPERGSNPRPPP